MRLPHPPATLFAVLLACTAYLSIGDLFHVHFGVIQEQGPTLLPGQAWWVPVLFAPAAIAFIALAWPFLPKIRATRRRDILVDGTWFIASYAATGVFGAQVWPLTLILTALWLMRVLPRADRGAVIVYSLLLALGGTLGEAALHATGICRYEPRSFLLVPAWLPALYLQGAPLALAIARWLRDPAPAAAAPMAMGAQARGQG